jgi:hypothetical protein
VGERIIFQLLAEQGHLLLPDEMFADLYSSRGRRSIAPRVMATVMVLILLALDGQALTPEVTKATTLLATVIGQDIEEGADGVFRIVRGVAADRVISTVDPEARHGHKTAARGFDGYKGHIAVDAESEIITATEVTAGNVGDASAAEVLLADGLTSADDMALSEATNNDAKAEVYGDASYGTADLVDKLESAGIEPNVKVQPPPAHS